MATFNWLITCGCENPIEYYCNTCGEKLCSNCKKTHLQNNDTRHHSVVEYAKKLMPSNISIPPCPDHEGKDYIYWCQTCGKPVCMDCVPSSHNGHIFVKLETVLQEKRARLQEELGNLESNDLKKWKNLLEEATKTTSDFLDKVDRLEKELEDTAKKFHRKVDEILENNKRQLKEMTASSIAVLREQEKRVSDGLEKIEQEIKELEDNLRNGDVESLLEHKGSSDKKEIPPNISSEVLPVFTQNQKDTKSLTEMFGKLVVPITEGAKNHSQSSTDDYRDKLASAKNQMEPEVARPKAVEHSKPIQASPGDTRRSGSDNVVKDTHLLQLISKPLVQSRFKSGCAYTLVACAGSGQVWVQTGIRKLELMDIHGSVKNTKDTDFDFNDTALSQQGDLSPS